MFQRPHHTITLGLLCLLLPSGCGQGDEAGTTDFVDITAESGITGQQWSRTFLSDEVVCGELLGGGAAAADYDGDGDVDVFLPRFRLPDQLWRNDGSGRFDDVAPAVGVDDEATSNGAAWADVDGDGDLDLLVTTLRSEPVRLYLQQDVGTFTEEGGSRGVTLPFETDGECNGMHSATFGDIDHDGDLDLFMGQWAGVSPSTYRTRMLRNDGSGHFDDITESAQVVMRGISVFGSTMIDLDADGLRDLLVTADYGNSRMYQNRGDGTFGPFAEETGLGTEENGMGSTFGDIDGDGDFDLFVTSIYDARQPCDPEWGCTGNRLFVANGDGTFTDQTDAYGVREGGWGWGTAMFDMDLDGDLDLGMGAGFTVGVYDENLARDSERATYFEADPMRLWRNDGSAPLAEVSQEWGLVEPGQVRSFVPFDADGDTDLDVLLVVLGDSPRLFRNDHHVNPNGVRFRLAGRAPNTFAVGAIVEVQTSADSPTMTARVGASPGFLGQRPLEAHFGLGEHVGRLHRVTVTWPTDGEVTVFDDVAVERPATVLAAPSE